jgi:hypothetical protein
LSVTGGLQPASGGSALSDISLFESESGKKDNICKVFSQLPTVNRLEQFVTVVIIENIGIRLKFLNHLVSSLFLVFYIDFATKWIHFI